MRALIVSLVLALPAVAAADALAPPPRDCPRGSRGRTARVGQWCEPTTCGEGRACEGWSCPDGRRSCGADERRPSTCASEPVALCVRTQTRTGFRRTPDGVDEVEQEITETLGPCGPNDACDDGATCERARRCVPGEPVQDVRGFVEGPPGEEPGEEVGSGGGSGTGSGSGSRSGEEDAPAADVVPADSGCGCRVGGPRGGAGWLALLAGLLWVSRRARR